MPKEEAVNGVAELFEQRSEEIRTRWVEIVKSRSSANITAAELDRELSPIFSAISAGIRNGNADANSDRYDEVRAMLVEYSRTRARQGFSPSETATVIFSLRDAALAVSPDQTRFGDFPAFSRLIDDFGLLTFESFARTRETIISNQSEQLLELSTPVVKLWEGILAVPLVGTLDSARTQVVMESLLQELVSTGSAHAIIDITGVPAVDTEVAQHLLKTVFAARLMGANCVISGIRPQIAQTIVGLGIDFGDISTKASLADALKLTLQRAGLEVRRLPARP